MIARICKLLKMKQPELNAGLLFGSGKVVPADATAGWQTGAIFQHTDGGANTSLYVNEGSETSSDFDALSPSVAGDLTDLSDVGATAYTAGSILVADGNSYEEVAVSGDATLASSGALTINKINNATVTLTDGPATTRLVRSELVLTPTTNLDGSGTGASFTAIRGATTLTTGKSVSDGYLYGVQGKFVGDGATINNGSQHTAAVLAQMSGSSMVVTSGHVGVLVVSGQSLPASANVNMIYAESGGNKINSVLQSNVACNFLFDVNNFENCGIVATPTGAVHSGNLRTLKVQIDGGTYFILASAVISS